MGADGGGAVFGPAEKKRGRGLLSHHALEPRRKEGRRGSRWWRRSASSAVLQWRRRRARMGARETVRKVGKLGLSEGGQGRPQVLK
jgi:hypothetical protein